MAAGVGSTEGSMGYHRAEIAFINRICPSSDVRIGPEGVTACILFFLVYCFFACAPMHAQESPCDLSLKLPSGDSPYSYRRRSDRCEGIYAREVAGDILLIGSVTESFEDFAPTSGGRLRLSWKAPGNEAVHLRVYSLRPHFYYRMDSAPPPGSTVYAWPTDILAALKVQKGDLGVVAAASTSLSVCGPKPEIYLPLRIGVPASPASTPHPQAVLLSDVELSEVYVTVTMLGPAGQKVHVMKRNKALGYGDYPAEVGITVPLPDVHTKGVYLVEVAATLRPGGSSNLRFCVYQSKD